MNEIVPRSTSALVARDVRRALRSIKGDAAVRATTMEAATYVTQLGIEETAFIGALEEAAIKRAPLAEGRVQVIADAHAAVMVSQVVKPW